MLVPVHLPYAMNGCTHCLKPGCWPQAEAMLVGEPKHMCSKEGDREVNGIWEPWKG